MTARHAMDAAAHLHAIDTSVAGLWGKLYVMGGCNGWDADGHCTNLTASVEVFNVAHNNWSMAAPMPTARWGLGATVWRGKIIAMGGEAANLTRLSTGP